MKLGCAHHTNADSGQGICRQVCGAMFIDIILFKGPVSIPQFFLTLMLELFYN